MALGGKLVLKNIFYLLLLIIYVVNIRTIFYFSTFTSQLVADGIAGDKTMEKLFPSTDLQESDAWIEEYHLPMGEYVNNITDKEYIFIHHTAGWNNPYKCIDQWSRDSRGRIATQYVIGGPHPKTKDATISFAFFLGFFTYIIHY